MPARLGHVPRLEAPLHPDLPTNCKGRKKKAAIYKNMKEFLTVLLCAQASMHTHTCAHSKTCTVTPPTLCFTITTQEGFTNPITVGQKFLEAGSDGVLVSPRTTWEEVKLPLSRSSCCLRDMDECHDHPQSRSAKVTMNYLE